MIGAVGTVPPCPAWCVHPDGHDFQEIGYFRLRSHRGPVVRVDWSTVDVFADEGYAEGDATITRFRPRVAVDTGGGAIALGGPAGRRLAAALLNAADEWDEITGATS